jgi:hypothetical protein
MQGDGAPASMKTNRRHTPARSKQSEPARITSVILYGSRITHFYASTGKSGSHGYKQSVSIPATIEQF